jgi:hypothetical protein
MADKWLTPKQFRFVQAIIQGKTHAEAYKAAGFSAHNVKVAEPNARKLLQKYAVARAIEIGRAAVAERSLLTAELIIERLEEARQLALSIDPPQIAGAVAATLGQARIAGLLIDRSEAHIVHHRPAPSPVAKTIELSEEEWKKQFGNSDTDQS